MRKYPWLIVGVVLILGLAVYWYPSTKADIRWFENQTYNYEVLRTLGEGVYGGAEAGEVLAAIRNVREGDDEAWFLGWDAMARRVEEQARRFNNPVSRGKALLRAANYYRTAEFFLHPQDKRRLAVFHRSVAVFEEGLNSLEIEHEILDVPYGNARLKAMYYPGGKGSEAKPLIVAHGGYDSTQEEMYFFIVAAALERGYSCLTFAGPGQGEALREYGLQFTPEWEKPTGAVLDRFIEKHGRPRHIVLVGVSLGGYLAPRAAAFDRRIDGVVAHNVCFDFQEAALRQMPGLIKRLYNGGHTGIVNWLMAMKMKSDPGLRWGIHNAEWTLGAKQPTDVIERFGRYSLADEAPKITCDVLITAGERDHFFPVEQVEKFKNALTHARSVTTRVFTEQEGGHEHCQQGAMNLFHGVLFDWIEAKF
ncbi:MAG TPA: alpha/beta fold hydrolase [Syntrophales bacterium]|nr:alpha/beta fold hydrolase [Syntrophales bacterium]